MTDAEKIQVLAKAVCELYDELMGREPPDLIAIASAFNSPTSSDSSREIPDTSWVPGYFELILRDGKPRPPIMGEWYVWLFANAINVDIRKWEGCIEESDKNRCFAVRAPAGAVAFRVPKGEDWFLDSWGSLESMKLNRADFSRKLPDRPGIGRRRWIIDKAQRKIALASAGETPASSVAGEGEVV